jgi:cytochrome b561
MKAIAILLSLAFFVLGILYWNGTLQAGVSHTGGPHHSHGILFVVLAVLSLIWLRFQSHEPTVSRVR